MITPRIFNLLSMFDRKRGQHAQVSIDQKNPNRSIFALGRMALLLPLVCLTLGQQCVTAPVLDDEQVHGWHPTDPGTDYIDPAGAGISAEAGFDLDVSAGDTVTLNGSNSYGEGSLSFTWSQSLGRTVRLSSSSEANATFIAPVPNGDIESFAFQLRLKDGTGETDSDEVVVRVHKLPTDQESQKPPCALFTTRTASLNTPLAVQFSASLATDLDGTIESYVWDFGDGTTGTGTEINHTYRTSGVYICSLTVTDNDGATGFCQKRLALQTSTCNDTNNDCICDNVTLPTLKINPIPATTAGSAAVEFVSMDGNQPFDQSQLPEGSMLEWDLGDGTVKQGTAINHVYSSAGSYVVTLTLVLATVPAGCQESTVQMDAQAYAVQQQPADDQTTDNTQDPVSEPDTDEDGIEDIVDNCDQVANADQADSDGDSVGNACDNCPNVSNPDQADADADGVGDLCDNCVSTPNANQQDTDSDTVGDVCDNCPATANPEQNDGDCGGDINTAPTANAGNDQNVTDADGNGSESVTLDGSGSDDPDGTISSYKWNEAGSTIATGASPSVTLSVGEHVLTLQITDNEGATDTDEVTITVKAGVAQLEVTPQTSFSSSGSEGDQFSPDRMVYTLTNTGGTQLAWSASKSQSWITLGKTSGTLLPSATETVEVRINANASSLSAGSYSDTVTFTNTTNGQGNTTRPVNLTVFGAKAYTHGGNISYGWAGTASNDASAGTASWNDAGNATTSDDSDATVTLANNASQYLVFSNFTLSHEIPDDAIITGMEFHVEGKTANVTPVCTEASIVKGGVISATNLAADEPVGIYEYRGLYYGNDSERWGENWTAADVKAAGFGLAIRISSTGNETVEIDSCRALIHWAKTPSAKVTLQKATTPMAPCSIHANVLESTIGDSSWEKVGVKWSITGPAGWTMTTTDPRPGAWGDSRPRDCANDMWGYNTAIYADVPGSYTIQATLYLEDGTTVTSSEQVTVVANTRTVRYLKQDGDDGLDGSSWANAWATWEYAISQLTDNMELVVKDDHTWHVTSALSNRVIKDLNNVIIRRSNDGAAKPVIEATASVPVFALLRLTDCVLDGLDIRGIATPESGVFGAEGAVLRLTLANIDGSQGHNSFWEMNGGYFSRQLLCYNSTFRDLHRYAFFLGQLGSDSVFLGCAFSASTVNPPTGEGALRLYTDRLNVLWCSFDTNSPYAGLRAGSDFTHCYQCDFGRAGFGVGETGSDSNIWAHHVKRYDGVYGQQSSPLTVPERNYFIMVCNSVFIADAETTFAPILKRGHHRYVTYANNTLLANGVFAKLLNHTSTGGTGQATFKDISIVNNLLAANGVDNNSAAAYDRPELSGGSSYVFTASNGGRLENNVSPVGLGGAGRWRLGGAWYTSPAAVNALEYVSGENVSVKTNAPDAGRGLASSDLSSALGFLPAVGEFTAVHTNGQPEPGVWVDYRGVLRDQGAASWAVGGTSLD